MKNKKVLLSLASMALMLLIWSGCNKDYDYVAPKMDAATSPPVKFSSDIYPILSTSCNKSGCHLNNDNPPDFSTQAIAYDQMWVNDNGNVLIDTVNDENSILYQRLIKTTSGKMPPSGNLPTAQTDLILIWIKQGAKNN